MSFFGESPVRKELVVHKGNHLGIIEESYRF